MALLDEWCSVMNVDFTVKIYRELLQALTG
jgi:hypothetical protein